MDLILFYGIPLAISALFFATGHYTMFFIYIVATALQDYLPKVIMNKNGDARFLVLLHMAAQLLVTIGAVYAIYLVIALLFF